MLALLVCTLIALALLARAYRSAARVGREALLRRRPGEDGIVSGAEPIELTRDASAPAVLLLHGGGDTPQTLGYLATYLHERGFAVRAPLLPGHGRSVHEFSRVSAGEWLATARTSYRDLRSGHAWVGVVGLSMGGALAVQLAADAPELPALVLLAPYLTMPRGIEIAARFAPVWGVALPYVRALDPEAKRSILDPAEEARNLAYGVFTPAALRALRITVVKAFAALPRLTVPTLVVQSREDNRIAPRDAERAFARIGASEKRLVWTEGAGHVITVDYGRERVFEMTVSWLNDHRDVHRAARGA